MKKTFKIKQGLQLEQLQYLQAEIFLIVYHVLRWHRLRKKEAVLTNILEIQPHSTVDIHGDGRALDWRTKHLSDEEKSSLVEYLEKTCGHVGAISSSDYQQRVAVLENQGEENEHLHTQVKPA